MTKPGVVAIELAAQIALALAIGLSVSLVLAGAALLFASGDAAEPHRLQPASQARTES